MELLKHGFQVSGRDQGHWPTELEWLFRLRNLSVHHGEELRPLVEEMRTDRVVVFAPAEAETFSPENARRAADFAKEVIEHCIQHPKPATPNGQACGSRHWKIRTTSAAERGYHRRMAQAAKPADSEIERRRKATSRLRGLFADVAPGESLVDELIADRRAEARAEGREGETRGCRRLSR
jgi:hypothetical protein